MPGYVWRVTPYAWICVVSNPLRGLNSLTPGSSYSSPAPSGPECTYVYVCLPLRSPEMVEEGVIEIEEGRHPVIDLLMEGSQFVANDTKLSVCV